MNRLKEFREKKGFSQEEVSSFLGIDRTSLSKIENNKQNIDPILLFKISKYYNVSP